MQLRGTDFEFVDSVALLESKNSESRAAGIHAAPR
jgi:hypothetical protein